jgi:hypothetical protein
VLVAAAVMYSGIWAQVTLFHWGAAFASRAMWAPVIEGRRLASRSKGRTSPLRPAPITSG